VFAARGDVGVLQDVDLVIEPGSTALLGPSGSGKSTLLRLLNRLAEPQSGTVRFRGEDVRTLDVLDLRRQACLVPQLPALLSASVTDNVRYGPRLVGRRPDVTRFLELAGLARSYADRDARRLSVGEQQRVMLARALALEPRVLLLDEPTSALDEEASAGVERTLWDLQEHLEVSTVMVTHDRSLAARLSTRVVQVRDGRVAATGAAVS